MTRIRKWSMATAAAVVLLLVAGWFLLVSPKRGEAAELRDQAVAQEDANASLELRIKQLEAQAADLPAQQGKLARLARQMPDDPQLPALIRDLTGIAASSGAELQTIAPSAAEPLLPAEAAAVAQQADPTAAASSSAVPVSITVGGEFSEIERFLFELEQVERAFLVNGFTLSAEDGAGGEQESSVDSGAVLTAQLEGPLTLVIQGRVFVSAPIAAAPTPAPSPSATGDEAAASGSSSDSEATDASSTPAPEPTATATPQ